MGARRGRGHVLGVVVMVRGTDEMTGAQVLIVMLVALVLFGAMFVPSMLWPNQPPARAVTIEHPSGHVVEIGTACRVWVDHEGTLQERGC